MTFFSETEQVLKEIDQKTLKSIQKDNPFRKIRDEAIAALGKRGIRNIVLMELSGLSDSSISRILQNKPKRGMGQKENILFFLKKEFDNSYKRFRRFILALERKEAKKGKIGRGKKS